MKDLKGNEKGFAIGGIVCLGIGIFFLIFILIGIGIIPCMIISLSSDVIGIILMVKGISLRKKRLANEGNNDNQIEKKEEIKKEEKPIIKEKIEEKPIIKEEPKDLSVNSNNNITKNKKSKAPIIIICSILLFLLVGGGIVTTILLLNKNNGIINNNSNLKFDIKDNTYFEETSDNRIDGYLFKPSNEFVLYRFELKDDSYYVTNIEYGIWNYDSTDNYIHAICSTYEYYDSYFDVWNSNTYSEGASNATKDLKLVSNNMLYYNGNSNFKIKKVNNFTYPISKYHE